MLYRIIVITVVTLALAVSAQATFAPSAISGLEHAHDCGDNAADADCKCCDLSQSCPATFCLVKCFNLLGDLFHRMDDAIFNLVSIEMYESLSFCPLQERPQSPPPRD